MELDQFGIPQPSSGVNGQAEGVTGVFIPARGGAAPDAGVAAGGENHGIGMDEVSLAGVDVETIGAKDLVVFHQQTCDVDRIEDRDFQLFGPVHEAALDFQSGVVTGKGGAAEGVRTEETLRDPAVVLTGETHAVAFQIADPLRRSAGNNFDGVWVGQEVTFLDGVGRVLLPGVVLVHGAQRGVDASGS